MGDSSIKEAVSCPIRDFSPVEFPSSNTNLCNSENDNSTSANDERKDSELNCIGSKENFSHPNLSLGLTKKIEDAQDSVPNPDLHNGHNNSDAVNNSHSNSISGGLMKEQDTEDLSETVLMDSPKEASKETDKNSDRDNETRDSLTMDQESSNISLSQNIEGNSEEDKAPDDSMSQDFFEDDNTKEDNKEPSPDSIEKNDQSNSNDNQDTEMSEGFNLNLSQTQSFLPAEKQNDAQVVSESEDETNDVEDESNDKTVDPNDKVESEDVEMSNESSNNTTSTQDVPDGKENSAPVTNNCDAESTKETEEEQSGDGVTEKMEVNDTNDSQEVIGEDEESLSNGEPTSENNCEENSRLDKEVDETLKVNYEKVEESDDLKVEESEERQAIEENGEALVKSEEPQASKESNLEKEEEEIEVSKEVSEESHNEVEEKKSVAETKVEETEKPKEKSLESSEQVKPVTPKVSSRLQRKRLAKQEEDAKQSTTDDKKAEPMEIDCPTNESTPILESTHTCSCKPSCHSRLGTVSQHLSSACSQLDEFIKLKRREENKLLKNFLDMLKEVHNISENTETIDETKITAHALIPEETGQKRKSLKRKSTDIDTPSKESPRKKIATEEKAQKKSEKKSTIEFKDLKGLAVFAKWPNSGWYYPGKVEELTENDWKEANNVTVKFYDGLVREMKNINILPAYLIPSGSMVCDLEDETEMVVLSCDGSNQNSVDFKLSVKDNSNEIELNFNKLAIRANHMKTIKQQLEPTTDVVPKKMHMVSLDNLVSGRRSSRGRSKKDLDSEESPKTPNQTERRSTSLSSSTTPSKKNTKRGKN